jgi:hypothetical protein
VSILGGDDTMDLDSVLNGIGEEHKVHFLGSVHDIEVNQLVLSNLSHLLTVGEFTVNIDVRLLGVIVVRVSGGNETGEEQRRDLDDGIVRFLECLFHVHLNHFDELGSIFIRDKTIVEGSSALVSPQFNHVIFVADGLRVGLGDSLEHFRDISQVISVMGFSRSRSEFNSQFLVGSNSGEHNLLFQTTDGSAISRLFMLHEVPVHDGVENGVERGVGVRFNVNGVEMADESACDNGFTSSRGSHSAGHGELGDLTEFLLFGLDLVPALVVHPLTEELNSGLSSVNSRLFNLGHAQIIDEHDSSAVTLGDVVAFT